MKKVIYKRNIKRQAAKILKKILAACRLLMLFNNINKIFIIRQDMPS